MESMYNLLIILLWISIFGFTQELNQMNPFFDLKAEELIQKYNYPFEKFTIQTEDGYLLEIHRIPNTNFVNKMQNIPPVLLLAGLDGDSLTWVSLGSKGGLAFFLADNGYDVWMGNYRGSTLCKKHISLDPDKDKKFWSFSFQELGYYDIPATIDHILNITNKKQLLYVGFSQGTTSYFAMLSEKPNYNDKIKFAVGLAPVASLENCLSGFAKLLGQNLHIVKDVTGALDMHELFLNSKKIGLAMPYCSSNSSYRTLCAQILCTFYGTTMAQLNKTALPLLLNTIAGGSTQEALHTLQLMNGIFCKYDYGKDENLKNYGQENPPMYNLSKTIVPTAFIYGSYDVFASEKDVTQLALRLPNIVQMKPIPKFGHLDLVLGIDAPTAVFPNILKYLQMYS